jgi:hypothetical protein
MAEVVKAELSARYSYRDDLYPANAGRAVCALGLMKCGATCPPPQISLQYGETQ